jgi:hypothetical protein
VPDQAPVASSTLRTRQTPAIGSSSARAEASATGVEADGVGADGAALDAEGPAATGGADVGWEAVGAGEELHAATRDATSPSDDRAEAVRRRRAEVIARVIPQASRPRLAGHAVHAGITRQEANRPTPMAHRQIRARPFDLS